MTVAVVPAQRRRVPSYCCATISGPSAALTASALDDTSVEGTDVAKRTCSIPGCGKPHNAHGFCQTHERQARKAGTLPPPRTGPQPLAVRFWAKVVKTPACWLWQAGGDPYGVIGRGGKGAGQVYVHRLSWELHYGPVPPDLCVCHQCDTPLCVNPEHLFLGTHEDNQRDKVEKRRHGHGETHHMVALGAAQVIEMRRLWADGGLTQAQIAERFQTTKGNVSQIVRGKRWRELLPADWVPPARNKWSRAS